MNPIKSITGLEILDSRSNPTVMVTVTLSDGLTGFGLRALRRIHRASRGRGAAG